MTERYEHPTLPGFSQREYFESLTPDQLLNYILDQGERVTAIEKDMDLAAEVLEGGYGLSVEDMLSRKEKNNQTNTGVNKNGDTE